MNYPFTMQLYYASPTNANRHIILPYITFVPSRMVEHTYNNTPVRHRRVHHSQGKSSKSRIQKKSSCNAFKRSTVFVPKDEDEAELQERQALLSRDAFVIGLSSILRRITCPRFAHARTPPLTKDVYKP